MTEKKWHFLPTLSEEKLEQLHQKTTIPIPLCHALFQRGISTFEEAKSFFTPGWDGIHSPLLMQDMEKARDRVISALEEGEKIMVYGDYDVDGTTSVSVVANYLNALDASLITYIPDRYKEGYGISILGMDTAKEEGCGLVIALDCGIKAHGALSHAKKLGLDVIVCDHHLPGKELPEAFAILDPKRSDCAYPYKELSGCGVGFKLLQALAEEGIGSLDLLLSQTDLLATSIAADIVALTGENRDLAAIGLEKINTNPNPGLKALMSASPNKTQWRIADLVFGIAPRINACGRIKSGNFAVEVLTETNFTAASEKAIGVNHLNGERKFMDKEITESALEMIAQDPEHAKQKTTMVWSEEWHKGVIGIVASRLIEQHYRPTIVLTKSKGLYTGSARSVMGYDVHEALEACADLMEQFGGHKYAAGMSVKEENIAAFKQRFEEVVSSTILPEQEIESVDICGELELEDISQKFWNVLDRMEPFGPQNMQPLFCFRGLKDNGRGRILNDEHLKLEVFQPEKGNQAMHAIAFKMAPQFREILDGKPFDCVASIDSNVWRNNFSLQLQIRDIRWA